MAEVYEMPQRMAQIPETPTKSNIMVSSSEVAEEPTPAPTYAETATTHMTSFPGDAAKFIDKLMRAGGPHLHPSNPTGHVTHDLRDHLPCHQNFNNNVEVIIFRYNQLRKDYDQALLDLGKAQRDLRREVEEKESWKARCKELEVALSDEQSAHNETREKLARVQAELFETQLRLDSAIKQLAEAVQKLEAARKALREMTRERDLLKLQVIDLERDLQYYKSRVTELQKAVDIANDGENCANDRNARLTVMLFQIEAQKAEIEREKDRAMADNRNLRDELKEVTSRGLVEKLRREIAQLEVRCRELDAQLVKAYRDLVDRDSTIAGLRAQIGYLEGERESLRDNKKRYETFVREFEQAYSNLENVSRRKHVGCPGLFAAALKKKPIFVDDIPIYISETDTDRAAVLNSAFEGALSLYKEREDDEVDVEAQEKLVESVAQSAEPEPTSKEPEYVPSTEDTTPTKVEEPKKTEDIETIAEEKKAATEEDAPVDEPSETNTDAN